MFASLPPGGRLVRHRDPFAGSVRFHLGLSTPQSEACYIEVDGERYSWRDGEAVLFDETYLHYAENATKHQRIILFCDIERPMRFRLAAWCNRQISRLLLGAASSPIRKATAPARSTACSAMCRRCACSASASRRRAALAITR